MTTTTQHLFQAPRMSPRVAPRTDFHVCLVCGAGPFCSDRIGRHFDLCFEAHCPTIPFPKNLETTSSVPYSQQKGGSKSSPFGAKTREKTTATPWRDPNERAFKYTGVPKTNGLHHPTSFGVY
ncbi:hypothetical protein AeNC1_013196 [Aphanomyces euteiches]|nr:hypothetical protein AeNC1_013196 [Aphanomyces euteiches]